MKKLTNKQQMILTLIINFYKVNNVFPTINDLLNITKYKSYNSIYKYIDLLKKKNYIEYDNKRKQIIFVNKVIKNNSNVLIPFIKKNNYLNIIDSPNLLAIKVSDNNLSNYGIYKNDFLLISKNKSKLNNKFVGIKENNTYKIYKYIKKNDFHYLINDKEELIIKDLNCICFKVLSLIRNM